MSVGSLPIWILIFGCAVFGVPTNEPVTAPEAFGASKTIYPVLVLDAPAVSSIESCIFLSTSWTGMTLQLPEDASQFAYTFGLDGRYRK